MQQRYDLSTDDKMKFIKEVTEYINDCNAEELSSLLLRPLPVLLPGDHTHYLSLHKIIQESFKKNANENQKLLGILCETMILCNGLPKNFVNNIIISDLISEKRSFIDLRGWRKFTAFEWKKNRTNLCIALS